MRSRIPQPISTDADDEYGEPGEGAHESTTWSDIASTAAATATPRTWAEIAASAADSANASAEAAHSSAISTLDALAKANPSPASESSSAVNAWSLWSLWFFVIGILLGALLTLAAIIIATGAAADQRMPVTGQQPIVVTEYPVPQPISPSDLDRLEPRPT